MVSKSQPPGWDQGATAGGTLNLVSSNENHSTGNPDSLLDPEWQSWAAATDDQQLTTVLRSARLDRSDVENDPDRFGEFPALSRQIYTLEAELEKRAESRGGVARDDGTLVEFREVPPTDMGNAERLIARFGHRILYSYTLNTWLVWNGTRWAVDRAGHIDQLAKRTVRAIYVEAAAASDESTRKDLAKHAMRSEARNKITAMIETARSEVPVSTDDLDADPWLLNVNNGTVDLRTGELRRHDPKDYITKLAPVDYHPNADCPKFLEFMERITGESPALLSYLQRLLGYCLTGNTREQVFPIAWGRGANGKSTLLNLIKDVLGDYATQTPSTTLLQRRGESVPNDLAALRGRRFVLASETDEGKQLSESLIKQVTGGDYISARFMRAEWFEFKPQFKAILITNHKPLITGTDNAIWRRIHLVPFSITIPEAERDDDLPDKLKSEASGILAWLVDGCLAWQLDGLQPPPEVLSATQQYRVDQDVLATWIQERCSTDSEARAETKDLYEDYARWCKSSGEDALTKRKFGELLTERGYEPKRTNSARYREGISLLAEDPPWWSG